MIGVEALGQNLGCGDEHGRVDVDDAKNPCWSREVPPGHEAVEGPSLQ